MSDILDDFLGSLSTQRLTVPGSHIRFGYDGTKARFTRTPQNTRERFVISWIVSGKGSFSENGHDYAVSDMYYCIRRPGRAWSLSFEDIYSVRIFFDLPEEMYPAFVMMIPELDNLPPVRHVEYSDSLLTEYLELFREMKNVSVTEFYTVLPGLIKYILDLTGISATRDRSPIDKARRMLEDAASPKTLEEIAAECNISYNTFRKQFAATFGVTPGQYRISCKMEAAKNALLTGVSVSEAAEKFGFSDVYGFTRRFRAVVGVPPARYREKHHK